MERLMVVLLSIVMMVSGCSTATRADDVGGSVLPRAELERFAQQRVFFAHQSVGNNILDGVRLIFGREELPPPRIEEASVGQSPPDGGVVVHTLIGVNGDPQSKFDGFRAALDSGIADSVDTAVLKLCYDDIVASTDIDHVFASYVATMERTEREHPQVRLIYTTVPLQAAPSLKSRAKAFVSRQTPASIGGNLARDRYNELVRAKYGATGRLLDLAAIESADGSGGTLTKEHSGQTYPVLHGDLSLDGSHLNEAGSEVVARQFIKVLTA